MSFDASKDTIKRRKRQLIEWKTCLQIILSAKGLVSRIYKEHINSIIKTKITQLIMGTQSKYTFSPKKIYKWSIST